ncbi:MAG TPA: heme-binding domain-containing protein [Pedobacter sp.]
MSVPARRPLRKMIVPIALVLLGCLILLQFVGRPQIVNPPVKGDLQAPEQVKNILKKACYDCHSNETDLRWYDQIAPAYWLVADHVKDGRKVLNFSNWKDLAVPDQKAKLWEAVNQIAEGAMPIKSYEMVHQSAKVSANDLAVSKNYLKSMVHNPPADTAKTNALAKQYAKWTTAAPQKSTPPTALNGIQYIPDYKNWQVVSSSDRFDNATMRVIFGNDIAIKAIKENHINPWPNGTIFAKVAWDKLTDEKGNVHTGAFKQVEYMIKDDRKYESTKGWGFARFKTPKMVPYGKDKLFATECINCHRPESESDFVFTMPIKH